MRSRDQFLWTSTSTNRTVSFVEWIACLGAGLLAGALHVYLGPDHLAALAVLSVREPRRAWLLGLRWGVGHAGGVLIVAALALLTRGLLDFEGVSRAGELLVGLSLIALGAWGFSKRFPPKPPVKAGAAWAVGALHGVAGTSHLLGVLPGLAMPSTAHAAAYFAAFSIGTIAAMACFAAALGAASGGEARAAWLLRLASAASVAVGAVWIATL
jgi:nickel/cobalt exporter